MADLSKLQIPSQYPYNNLCWAAVTIGICALLDGQTKSFQQVATDCMPLCDGDLSDSFCDASFSLARALTRYGHAAYSTGNILAFNDIENELVTRHLPVGVMISLPIGHHYCVVNSCYSINNELSILDPRQQVPTSASIRYDALIDGSVLGGRWIDSVVLG